MAISILLVLTQRPAGRTRTARAHLEFMTWWGNGWEWTRTVFAPLPGFAPMPFYPGYSANFSTESTT